MELREWMEKRKYLPDFLKDFHDQKKLFKNMHRMYEHPQRQFKDAPSWVIGHIYVIDWFLWYVGRRGYTLQKNRTKNVDFVDFD